ncbi:uncharacterized protein E0L32_012418 [Thyridium curvatum]|uniref:SnoaL-like domain-containing protein n=1 Tax=Thyridium curvatum TaxID=1093900 RepID=A0A507B9S5_9PEZI|nr:uncharacterized protein E0L32_012418 [Thyridium curvatum]TPX16597.1 hypothetical protein E0L32_012418 [Thyridium curvatum]
MVDLHSLPKGSQPANALRNNGPDHLVLERLKLRELAEGWPSYRDACEWENFQSIFHPGAYVFTTWSGRVLATDFIEASKAGMDRGAFIMHRCHGLTTDINQEGTRAVTKMKATITQRFEIDGCEIDVECDCRFCFFFEKVEGRWGAHFVRHWYEKDKVIPANPARFPRIDDAKLQQYPPGYKYLAYFQEATMGVKVLTDMPGHRRHVSTQNLEKHDLLYWQAKDWLEGRNLDI